MRKSLVPVLVVLGAFATACSFQMSAGSGRKSTTPQAATPAPATTIPTPSPQAARKRPHRQASSTTPTSPTPTPGVPATMTGTSVFGTSVADPNGYVGSLYTIPAGTTSIPDLNMLMPIGTLYASALNVPWTTMTGGFPGINPSLNENFAIRWEAPLIVDNEADYTFRVASDNGSIVRIDDMVIVDNDGNHTFAERSGPVHLIRATHFITVDYFQTTGNVALQLFCRRGSEPEMICPTRL